LAPAVSAIGSFGHSKRRVLEALAEDLHVRGHLDIRESFIDGSFASEKGYRR
jgi:hypothetical protein